jgi:hypothetical protein
LYIAEKSTNIHINTEGKHEELLLACIQHDQTAVCDCIQSRISKLNNKIQFQFFPINLYLQSVTDGPSFGYSRVYLILYSAPDTDG